MADTRSIITLDDAKRLMITYGDIYINRYKKDCDNGIIRTFQVFRERGFILDTIKNKYNGEYGDFIVQIEDKFSVMNKDTIFVDFFKDSRGIFMANDKGNKTEQQKDKDLFKQWIVLSKQILSCRTLTREERSLADLVYSAAKGYLVPEKPAKQPEKTA